MVSSLMRQMQLEPFFLGFDDAFNQLMGLKNDLNKHISNYPPYNIKKIDDNEFELEFAVAGFDKKDVKVVMDMGKLRAGLCNTTSAFLRPPVSRPATSTAVQSFMVNVLPRGSTKVTFALP